MRGRPHGADVAQRTRDDKGAGCAEPQNGNDDLEEAYQRAPRLFANR